MFPVTNIVLLFALLAVLPCHFLNVNAAPRPHILTAKARRALDLEQNQINALLDAHNSVRAEHNAVALTWSPELANKAAFWAGLCLFKHSDGLLNDRPYGENIVAATRIFPVRDAVATFVSDKDQYDPANPSYTHFTQVVWKSTTQLGCAIAKCDDLFDPSLGSATLYVCLYDPAGNVVGDAPANVQL